MTVTGLIVFSCVIALANSYSVVIDARTRSCFGQNFKTGSGPAMVEIQVTRGGEADISYELLDPYNNILKSEEKVQALTYEFNVTQNGQYQICLDNTFSTSTPKIVMLEFNHAQRDAMQVFLEKYVDGGAIGTKGLTEEFRGIVEGLMRNSDRLERMEEINAAKKRRHFFLVQSSLTRVNTFSFLSCIVMIAVGVLQVFIVKGLFEDGNRKSFKFW